MRSHSEKGVRRLTPFLILALAAPCRAQNGSWRDAVLLYLPMDGSADAARAGGDGKAVLVGPVQFLAGRRGKALALPKDAGCSYALTGNVNRESGSLCAWVSLNHDTAGWDPQQGSWYQWLFGLRDWTQDPAQRSDLRVFFDRSFTLQMTTPQPKPVNGMAAAGDLRWSGGSWHHVGLTYEPGRVQLYVDGEPHERALTTCTALAGLSGRLLLGCADEAGHGSLDGLLDEVYVLSRPLTAAEMKTVYLATGPAGGADTAPVLPEPLFAAPLNGATAAKVAGKGTVDAQSLGLQYTTWPRGRALLVERRAYDLKASCGYLKLPGPLPRQGGVMFQLRPAGPQPWSGTERGVRRPLVTLTSPSLALSLTRSAEQQLVAAVERPAAARAAFDIARWTATETHHVAATWDFDQHTLTLWVDGRAVANTALPAEVLPGTEPTFDLWLGADDADRYKGDCADAAFRDLRIYGQALDADQVAAVAAGREGVRLTPLGLPDQPLSTVAPGWETVFAGTGLGRGIDEYLAVPVNGGPRVAAAEVTGLLHYRGAPVAGAARSLMLWFRLPPRSLTATTARVLSLQFAEPDGAVANFEDNALSQRLVAAITDGTNLFGGTPSIYRLQPDAWHQTVLVTDAGRTSFYLDGVAQDEADVALAARGIAEVAFAGEQTGVAEAAGFGRALSPREVVLLFNYGASGLLPDAPAKAAEAPYWDTTTAFRERAGGADRLCLNGLWRFLPADGFEAAPPSREAWGYSRIPGSFSAVHFWKLYDPQMKVIQSESWTDGRSLTHWAQPSYDYGWYERYVAVPPEWRGRRISLVFDRLACYAARVTVDGQLRAHWEQTLPGQALLYPERRVDLSECAGRDLRVSLQMGWDNAGAGDFPAIGDTWLTAEDGWVDLESLTPTTRVRPGKRLELSAVLHNAGAQPADVVVGAALDDKQQPALSLPAQTIRLAAGERRELKWQRDWPAAHLWSPDDPYLYGLTLQVKSPAGKLLKETHRRLGFREFWIDGRDFVLNGRRIHLRGTNANLPWHYLYTEPDYVRGMYRARKELGYNLIQYWSDASVDQMGGQSWCLDGALDLCDELGLIAAVGNVSHLQEVKDEAAYADVVDAFTRKYGAHAALCMWYVNPNTCWYNYGMHPGNLDCGYEPAEGEPGHANHALARAGEQAVTRLDPQRRPVFTYASGNFGPLYSAMQYFSLGLPFQEEADWPALWAERAPKPLIPVETDLKWTPHWTDFEAYERSWADRSPVPIYFVEHSARYLGDQPYRQTDHPARTSLGIQRAEGTQWNNLADEPYVLQTRALAARDILRGWRGYGMSGVTFHAEEDDLFESWSLLGKTFPTHTAAELQTPGPKPELWYRWFPRYLFADRPMQPYHESFRRNFAPLLAFIGGTTLEPERKLGEFTSQDHAYRAGETVTKQIVLINDRTDRDLAGRYEWRVTGADNSQIAAGNGAAKAASGDIAKIPFRFAAPAVTRRTDLTIRLRVLDGDKVVSEDTFDLQVHPLPPKLALEPLALVDPGGVTAAALRQAGVPFTPITSAAELAGRRAVVVGQGALAGAGAAILADFERSGALDRGVNVLVLAQPPSPLLNLVFDATYERYAWPRDAGSPVVQGLRGVELANWRGATTLPPAYPAPDPRTKNAPHYPGLKWHWGNRGIVSTYPFRKPAYGNFRVLADSGFDLVQAPLLEWLAGPSRVVLCQLDLAGRSIEDPVAADLLRRLCTYLAQTAPPEWRACTYMGSAAGRAYLAPHSLSDDARVPDGGVIVSDGQVTAEQSATLAGFAQRGGTVLLVNANVEALQRFGLTSHEEPLWHARLPEGDWPLAAGISPSDLYWREPRNAAVLTGLPAGAKATDPAVLAEIPQGQGRIVVMTVSAALWDDLLTSYENNRFGTHRAYYAKTANQDKLHRALSLLLTNLGVRMQHPQLAVFTGDYGQNSRMLNPLLRLELPQWRFHTDPGDVGLKEGWDKPGLDDAGWRTLQAPGMWQDQGVTDPNPGWQYDDPTMKHPYNGVAWYRVKLVIPAGLRGRELFFDADTIDDYDEVFLNGRSIGKTGKETPNWWSVPRHYPLPAEAIRFGEENLLAVRVTDTAGSGGFGGKRPPRVQAPAPESAFSPYLTGLSDYDINAFHNW